MRFESDDREVMCKESDDSEVMCKESNNGSNKRGKDKDIDKRDEGNSSEKV